MRRQKWNSENFALREKSNIQELLCYELSCLPPRAEKTEKRKHYRSWSRAIIWQIFFQVDFLVKYRYETIFRKVFHTRVEWCDLSAGLETNPLAKVMLLLLKDDVPNLFPTCPVPAVCWISFLNFFVFRCSDFLIISGNHRSQKYKLRRCKMDITGPTRNLQTWIRFWKLLRNLNAEVHSDIKTSFLLMMTYLCSVKLGYWEIIKLF